MNKFNKIKEAFDILYNLYEQNYELNYTSRYENRVHLLYDGNETLEMTLSDYFADGSDRELVITRNGTEDSYWSVSYEEFFNILNNITINKVIKTPVDNPVKDFNCQLPCPKEHGLLNEN